MHVTLVASAFLHPERGDFPGERRYSTELARTLARRGLHIRVVVPDDSGELDDTLRNIEVVRLKCLRNSLGRLANVGQAGMWSFAARFARTPWLMEETDLVQSTVPLPAIDTVRQTRPVVAFNHHLERTRGVVDLLGVPFGNSFGAYTYRRANAVVTPSETSAAELVRRLDINPRKLRVIHHGIETKTFFRVNRKFGPLGDEGIKRILFVGSMSRRKNVEFLLGVFRYLLETDRDLQLVLVGSGPLDSRVQRLGRSRRLRDKVVKMGRLSDDQLRAVYSAADVYAWPSLAEGFGFAAVEAMACGTPIVALDTPINREIIGDAGILVSDSTSISFAKAIRIVLEDPHLAKELGLRGLGRVEQRFSWTVAGSKYASLYGELINSKSRTDH